MNDEAALPGRTATTFPGENSSSALGLERLLTAAQLAEYLGLSPSTILDRFEQGRLPGYSLWRKGGPVRFRVSEIESFLIECRVSTRTR